MSEASMPPALSASAEPLPLSYERDPASQWRPILRILAGVSCLFAGAMLLRESSYFTMMLMSGGPSQPRMAYQLVYWTAHAASAVVLATGAIGLLKGNERGVRILLIGAWMNIAVLATSFLLTLYAFITMYATVRNSPMWPSVVASNVGSFFEMIVLASFPLLMILTICAYRESQVVTQR